MSAVDDLITALNASTKVNPATRAVLVQFLQAGAPVLNNLETSALQDLMSWLAGPQIPAPPAVDGLTGEQVVALLDVTAQQMDGLLEERVKQVAAARAAVSNLANTALSILIQALVSAL
jgi:hypothetical protein